MSTWHPDLVDPNEDVYRFAWCQAREMVSSCYQGAHELQVPVFELVSVNKKKLWIYSPNSLIGATFCIAGDWANGSEHIDNTTAQAYTCLAIIILGTL